MNEFKKEFISTENSIVKDDHDYAIYVVADYSNVVDIFDQI